MDAIQLEEDKLEGRVESMASLTLTMTELLNDLSQQQAEQLRSQESLEPEYRWEIVREEMHSLPSWLFRPQ